MFGSFWRIDTNRSIPMANPAWGGVPYLSASRNQPNLRSAVYESIPSTSNTFACTPASWILTLPEPNSEPLRTRS